MSTKLVCIYTRVNYSQTTWHELCNHKRGICLLCDTLCFVQAGSEFSVPGLPGPATHDPVTHKRLVGVKLNAEWEEFFAGNWGSCGGRIPGSPATAVIVKP